MTPFSSENIVQPPRKRRRPARSCDECRRRKVKCDLKQPCSHCIISKCSCFYSINNPLIPGTALNTVPPRSLEGYPSPRHLGSSQLSPSLTAIPPSLASNEKANPSSHCLLDVRPEKESELEVLQRRVATLEQVIASSVTGSVRGIIKEPPQAAPGAQNSQLDDSVTGNGTLLSRQDPGYYGRLVDITQESPLSEDRQLMLNKSRLYGLSHWTNGGHEFKRVALANADTSHSAEVEATKHARSEIQRLMHKCKLLARNLKASSPSRSMPWAESSPSTIDHAFADQMAQLYVSHFESALRILHVPSFWAEYSEYWRNPTEASSVAQFKIKLVLAIGSSLYRDAPDADMVRLRSSQWVHTAQSWLSAPMEKDRINISGLQVQCLLILARQVLSISGDLTWIAVGTLLRTAMHMGLHRDPRNFVGISLLHAEIRRRLWASILEMNIQASLDSGAPLIISYDDFDTESPGNINDEDIDESTTIPPQYASGTTTDTTMQRLLLRHLRLRMELIRRINGLDSGFSQDEIQSMTSQLVHACQECKAHAQCHIGNEHKIFQHNLAELFLRRFLLTLHRPLASSAGTGHLACYFSRKVCIDSATALLFPLPNAEFSHLGLIGGGIFKNRIIHASLAISSELLIDLDENGSTRWPSSYRTMLIKALQEALRQAAGRIRLGETNVRLHMKLSIVMCRAECTDLGTTRQQRMLQTAKESLKMSYATMQARLDSVAIGRHPGMEVLGSQDFDQQDLDFSFSQDLDDLFGPEDFGMNEIL